MTFRRPFPPRRVAIPQQKWRQCLLPVTGPWPSSLSPAQRKAKIQNTSTILCSKCEFLDREHNWKHFPPLPKQNFWVGLRHPAKICTWAVSSRKSMCMDRVIMRSDVREPFHLANPSAWAVLSRKSMWVARVVNAIHVWRRCKPGSNKNESQAVMKHENKALIQERLGRGNE